ncbi:hypothetical protein Pelo_2642 [Pelomyxa schiedti]|nr:hypothetical protein Pelo_2642 [Pelomyxa schiedti]
MSQHSQPCESSGSDVAPAPGLDRDCIKNVIDRVRTTPRDFDLPQFMDAATYVEEWIPKVTDAEDVLILVEYFGVVLGDIDILASANLTYLSNFCPNAFAQVVSVCQQDIFLNKTLLVEFSCALLNKIALACKSADPWVHLVGCLFSPFLSLFLGLFPVVKEVAQKSKELGALHQKLSDFFKGCSNLIDEYIANTSAEDFQHILEISQGLFSICECSENSCEMMNMSWKSLKNIFQRFTPLFMQREHNSLIERVLIYVRNCFETRLDSFVTSMASSQHQDQTCNQKLRLARFFLSLHFSLLKLFVTCVDPQPIAAHFLRLRGKMPPFQVPLNMDVQVQDVFKKATDMFDSIVELTFESLEPDGKMMFLKFFAPNCTEETEASVKLRALMTLLPVISLSIKTYDKWHTHIGEPVGWICQCAIHLNSNLLLDPISFWDLVVFFHRLFYIEIKRFWNSACCALWRMILHYHFLVSNLGVLVYCTLFKTVTNTSFRERELRTIISMLKSTNSTHYYPSQYSRPFTSLLNFLVPLLSANLKELLFRELVNYNPSVGVRQFDNSTVLILSSVSLAELSTGSTSIRSGLSGILSCTLAATRKLAGTRETDPGKLAVMHAMMQVVCGLVRYRDLHTQTSSSKLRDASSLAMEVLSNEKLSETNLFPLALEIATYSVEFSTPANIEKTLIAVSRHLNKLPLVTRNSAAQFSSVCTGIAKASTEQISSINDCVSGLFQSLLLQCDAQQHNQNYWLSAFEAMNWFSKYALTGPPTNIQAAVPKHIQPLFEQFLQRKPHPTTSSVQDTLAAHQGLLQKSPGVPPPIHLIWAANDGTSGLEGISESLQVACDSLCESVEQVGQCTTISPSDKASIMTQLKAAKQYISQLETLMNKGSKH